MDDKERLLSKTEIDAATGCWRWLASCSSGGRYGQLWMKSEGRSIGAHRAAWMIFKGPIPAKMQIDHLCRNTRCVNPAHMELVTNQENSRRGKGSVTACKHGHPYDEKNTGWKLDKVRGWRRYCRACARDAMRRKRA